MGKRLYLDVRNKNWCFINYKLLYRLNKENHNFEDSLGTEPELI